MLLLTAVSCLLSTGGVLMELVAFYSIARPRFLDNEFVRSCLLMSLFMIPFVIAVFTMMFTGTDISCRAINNKIATGLPRIHIYLADLIVTLVAAIMNYALYRGLLLAVARFWPMRSYVKFDQELINSLILVFITCIALAAADISIQYFFSNKLFAIIVALLILPCLPVVTGRISIKLQAPYRYEVTDKDSGESYWKLNPDYVGGTTRKVLTTVYNSCAYKEKVGDLYTEECVASGLVVVLSTAAGLVTAKKKEFS